MKCSLALCPALVFGNQDADDVLLLQMGHRVRIPETDVQDTLAKLTTTTNPQQAEVFLEKLATTVIKANATIDDTTKEVLKGVKQTFEDTSEVAINNAHNNDVAQLSSIASSTVGNCATTQEANKQDDKSAGETVSDHESSHQICRNALAGLEAKKEQKCGAFENFRQTLSPPSCTVPGSTDSLVDYLSTSQIFFASNLQQAKDHETACKTAIADVDAKKVTCNSLQVKFEMDFCVWRSESHETCYSYNTCYEEAAKSLAQAVANAEANEESRKLEWTALQKIKCYIDVIISDEETKTRQAGMDACKTLEPDTSNLNVVVPELAAPDACDLSSVAEFPCTGGFISRYDGMSGLQSCTWCPDLEPHLQSLSPQATVEKVVYTAGTNAKKNNKGSVTLTPNTDYHVEFEILRNDLGDGVEFVTDVIVGDQSLGECHPDGGDYDCTFFQCDFGKPVVNSGSDGLVQLNVKLQEHSWDCDCDLATWECSKESTVAGRTKMTAVGRFKFTAVGAVSYKEVGLGSCYNKNNQHGAYKQLSESSQDPATCYAACIREYGSNCAGFDTRSGCLAYSTGGDQGMKIVKVNPDGWTGGVCYTLQ